MTTQPLTQNNRLLEENKDIIGIGTSRTSLRFFAPQNKNFSTMLLSIFPIIVTDNLFQEVVLPPPFISIEDFAVCGFEESLCKIDGVTTCQTVCKYEDETYFRIMIGVPEGDIDETYTSLFDLFGFKHIKTDRLILEED